MTSAPSSYCAVRAATTVTVRERGGGTVRSAGDGERRRQAPRVSSSTRSPRSARGIAARRVRAAQKPSPPHCSAARVPQIGCTTRAALMPFQILSTLREGTGAPAKVGDKLVVHYKGTLADGGAVFDDSRERGHAFTFALGCNKVIRGWDEALVGRDEARASRAHPERRRVRTEGRAAADRRTPTWSSTSSCSTSTRRSSRRGCASARRRRRACRIPRRAGRGAPRRGGGRRRRRRAEGGEAEPQRRRRRLRLRLVVERQARARGGGEGEEEAEEGAAEGEEGEEGEEVKKSKKKRHRARAS